MDEQRMQAYVRLIEQLLDCPQGQEAELLQANAELVDARLLEGMEQYAVHLEGQGNGNAARWLRGRAAQLAQSLGQGTAVPEGTEAARKFLLETLLVAIDGNSQQVYTVWAQQQARFNAELLAVMPIVIAQLFEENPEQQTDLAMGLVRFGHLIQQFPLGDHQLNLELCIVSYEQVLPVYTRDAFPEQWAETQHNLAGAYSNRIRGERADNLERAIAAYQLALQVYTREAFPELWAATHHNLAIAYSKRIRGDGNYNLENAITGCQLALQVLSQEEYPETWAITQFTLANVYHACTQGDRAENLKKCIDAHRLALQVYTLEAFPKIWAMIQHNLTFACFDQIRCDRTNNLHQGLTEERLQAYLKLIEKLCVGTNGNVFDILFTLGANAELVDEELLRLMVRVTDLIERQESSDTVRLEQPIQVLTAVLTAVTEGSSSPEIQVKISLVFLVKLQKRIAEYGESDEYMTMLYQFLIENQPQLDITLAVLERMAGFLEQQGSPDAEKLRIFAQSLTNGLKEWLIDFWEEVLQLVSSSRRDPKQVYPFLEKHQHLLNDTLLQTMPIAAERFYRNTNTQWSVAFLFIEFGELILKFPMGNREINLELTIVAYELALRVLDPKTFSEIIAMTQSNLALAYSYRIRGERVNNLEQAIITFQLALQVLTYETSSETWAITQTNLANAYTKRIQGERADNLDQAITAYELALQVYTREAFPQKWAEMQLSLADAYRDRIRGDRSENIESGIIAYKLALQVYTLEAFPKIWALMQNGLVEAYRNRIQGDRADNLEQAISTAKLILQVVTCETFPVEWAITQRNLASAYRDRIRGDRAENIEQSIAAYKLALQVFTREAFPVEWALTQNNLALAYNDRIRGDRTENIEQAIALFQLALEIRTYEAFPEEWAMTQNNLASAYRDRIRGDRSENIEQAIALFQLALQVRTYEIFPEEWAITQRNLASAYLYQIQGNRDESLEQSINTYKLALQVFTREAFPESWAETQNNLTVAYRYRIQGDKAENLEQAIAAGKLALQVYTPETFPEKWADVQFNLARAYDDRIQGDKAENLEQAIATFKLALQVYTPETFPEKWADVQFNLARAYDDRIQGDKAENLEQAIATFKLALQVYTPETFPEKWADVQFNLARAYDDRIQGDKAENLEQAIATFKLALQVYTPETFPEKWAGVQLNLARAYPDRIRGNKAENLEQAATAAKLASQVFTREAFPEEWAVMQIAQAIVYQGCFWDERDESLEQGITAFESTLQVCSRETLPELWALTQINLAISYMLRGNKAENLEQAIAAAKLALQVYTPETFPEQWARTQVYLGQAYRRLEKPDRELQIYRTENSLKIERVDQKYPQKDQHDNLEQAMAAFELALQVYTHEAFSTEWADVQHDLALVHRDRVQGGSAENLQQAITRFQLALQIFTPEKFPAKCRSTACDLGDLHFEQKAWAEAADAYTLALEAAEIQHQSAILLNNKSAELGRTPNLPRQTAYALAQIGKLKAAALAVERGRARGLSEILDRNRADLTKLQKQAPTLYAQYLEVTNQLYNLEAQERLWMTSDNPHTLIPATLHATTQYLRQTLNETIDHIRQVPECEGFLAQPSFDDIHQAIRPGIPLVYLVITRAGSLALIISQDDIAPLWLNDFTEATLDKILEDWFVLYHRSQAYWPEYLDFVDQDMRQLITPKLVPPSLAHIALGLPDGIDYGTSQFGQWIVENLIDNVASQLWQPLMAPLIDYLQQQHFQQATLIPTDFLSLLPLHAAWTEDPTTLTGRRYALDNIHFTYAPNARSLTAGQGIVAQQTGADSILAIENPIGDLALAHIPTAAAITAFPQHQVLKHSEASIEGVQQALPNHNILHLFCHGIANLQEPLTSGLRMNDGLLTLCDLLSLKLAEGATGGIRLAILSACGTSLQGVKLADEAISLPTGLLQAGVAGVVGSLWSVDEFSTMLLLVKFYDNWRNHQQVPAEALHQAQQWLRDTTNREKESYFVQQVGVTIPQNVAGYLETRMSLLLPDERTYAHPYYWAAFQYVGV